MIDKNVAVKPLSPALGDRAIVEFEVVEVRVARFPGNKEPYFYYRLVPIDGDENLDWNEAKELSGRFVKAK
jgi:hypothetical protein